jgi:hypothetical protein
MVKIFAAIFGEFIKLTSGCFFGNAISGCQFLAGALMF